MKRKFVFVNLALNTGPDSAICYGISFLLPIVKKYKYSVDIIWINKEMDEEEFRNKIEKFEPDIIAFSVTSHQFIYLKKYSDALKKTGILQIAGGIHATTDPAGTLKETSLDGVCIGEGEIPMEKLLNNIEKNKPIHDTEGFFWKLKNGKIKKNSIPQFISDLSSLDFPEINVLGKNLIITDDLGRKYLPVLLSRGCPYNCHYCCNEVKSNVYDSKDNYFRIPSVEYSISLLERIISDFPEIEMIYFQDDNLIANQEWFLDFAKEYKKRINLPYQLAGRFECINQRMLSVLKKSNCVEMAVGLETGNEQLRKELLNKDIPNETIIEKSKMIKESEIGLVTLNMMGLPFETKKQMKETIQLNKKIKPDFGYCSFFFPYKGTELYNFCRKHGLLKSEEEMNKIKDYDSEPGIKMSRREKNDCLRLNKKLNLYFYKNRHGHLKYYFHKLPLEISSSLKTRSRTYERLLGYAKSYAKL